MARGTERGGVRPEVGDAGSPSVRRGSGTGAVRLWDLAEQAARQWPASPMFLGAGLEISYAEARAQALACADFLEEQAGIRSGSTVVWQLPTSPIACIVALALSRIGARQVPLLPTYGAHEVRHVVAEAAPAAAIVAQTREGRTTDLWRDITASGPLRLIPEVEIQEVVAGALRRGDAPAGVGEHAAGGARGTSAAQTGASGTWVFYTSGSESRPKGVRHDDGTIVAAAAGLVGSLALTSSDRILIGFPIGHIGGAIYLAAALETGCALVLLQRFVPSDAASLVRELRVTIATGGTAFRHAYLDEQHRRPDEELFASVRAFPGGGAPRSSSLHDEMRDAFGVGLLPAYGLTECPLITYGVPGDPDDKLASTEGRPTPGSTVVVRPVEGMPASSAMRREGEILVSGPQACLGYLDASLDHAAFTEDGLFRTGDLGWIDADGYLSVTGRLKDVIIRKGENVSAAELEAVLREHPLVKEVAVVGVPDVERGEMVCAVVVPEDRDAVVTLADLTAFLERRGVMRQKHPERLSVADALPLRGLGKPDKQSLRNMLAEAPPPSEVPSADHDPASSPERAKSL